MLRGLLGGYARGRRQTSSATLSLNFLAGINDSRITYSGGANGTRVNSAGVIVAATAPRFDYDPVTLAARGLLVEEARTNLLTYSDDYTSPNTFLSGGAAATVTPATGGLCSTRQTFAGISNQVIKDGAGNSTLVYANTIRLKAGTATSVTVALRNQTQSISIQYTVDLLALTLTDTSYGSPTSKLTPTIKLVGGSEYEVTIGGVLNAAGGAETLKHCLFSTGAGTLDCGGGQLEAGSFPTSYIPTTSASVTRTADSAVMTGTNFSDWYNQSEGTFVTRCDFSAAGYFGVPIAVHDNTGNELIYLRRNASNVYGANIVDGGVTQASIALNTSAATTVTALALAYATNDIAAVQDGGSAVTDVSAAIPTVDRLTIGTREGEVLPLNGHIRSIAYYPRRASNEQLQALTA